MLEAAWTSNFTPPARSRNFTRRAASASATLSVHTGGGARGRGPGAGKEGRSTGSRMAKETFIHSFFEKEKVLSNGVYCIVYGELKGDYITAWGI